MVLLDTNHCSYAILGNTKVLDRLANLGDEPITTCTIVKGELIDMAARSRAATGESCPDSTLSNQGDDCMSPITLSKERTIATLQPHLTAVRSLPQTLRE